MTREILASTAALAAALAMPSIAWAKPQDVPTGGGAQQALMPADSDQANASAPPVAQGSDDIVVTAQREASMLSKTPIAMTAITGEGLRNQGITDARQLTNYVPNVALTETGDAVRVTIRGVTSTDTSEKGDPSAAYLIDGIYIARPNDLLGSFYDVQRVEVLRGPQGTLYGRNTTAGVVNVITNRPTYTFAASGDVQYGNLDHRVLNAMLNVPLGTSLAVRAAFNYDRQDNYITEGVPSNVALDPFRKVFAGRLSVGGKVGILDFVIRGDYTKQQGTVTNAVRLSNFFPGTLRPTVDPLYVDRGPTNQRRLDYAQAYSNSRDNDLWGIQGEFTFDLTFADLTYLGSYRETKRNDTRNNLFNDALQFPSYFTGDYKQQSHELRLAFGRGNPLHGQVGGYFFREESDIDYLLGNPLASAVVPGASGYAFPQGPTVSRSLATFGQLTYDLTPQLHITGGLRYTSDRKSREGRTVVDFPNAASIPATLLPACNNGLRCTLNLNAAARSFSKLTWRAGVDYDVTDLGILYGSVSTGYKAGGFNDGCIVGQGTGCVQTEQTLYYNPETLTSYEAGFKFRFMNGAIRLNGSIFHYDYNNLQLSQASFIANQPQLLIRNAGQAKVDGVELESILRPSDNDRVDLSFNLTHGRYTDFKPDLVAFPSFSFDGKQLDRSPRVTWAAGYSHTFLLENGGNIEGQARTRFSSQYFLQDLNNISQFRQPSFTKSDVTLTYHAPGDRYYVQGFAKNIENAITLASASSGAFASVNIEEPRTYGVRAGFRF